MRRYRRNIQELGQLAGKLGAAGAKFDGDNGMAGVRQGRRGCARAGAQLQNPLRPGATQAGDRGHARLMHSRGLRVRPPPDAGLVIEISHPGQGVMTELKKR